MGSLVMITCFAQKFREFMREEDGASVVEYGVLLALIIAVCIIIIEVLGGKVNRAYDSVNTKFN